MTGAEKQRCKQWCGERNAPGKPVPCEYDICYNRMHHETGSRCACSHFCHDAGRPLNPAAAPVETGELTFVEACEAIKDGTEVQYEYPEGTWNDVSPTSSFTPYGILHHMKARHRLKPAPSPRVQVLARDESDRRGYNDDWAREMEDFGRRLLREVLEDVEQRLRPSPEWMRDIRTKYLGPGPKESR